MKKIELLKKLHEIANRTGDYMSSDSLGELQTLIIDELVKSEKKGRVALTRLPNGFIHKVVRIAKETP